MDELFSSTRYAVSNRDGWILDVRKVVDPERFIPQRPPILFVPGYGMNTHILGYHPRGASMVEHLCAGGYEVWLANLRGQGASTRQSHGRSAIGLADLALTDLPIVVDRLFEETASAADRLHMIGCSLGGSLAYAYLASVKDNHRLASLVSLGAPFRWQRVHPMLAVAAKYSSVVSRVPIVGTRKLAEKVIPLARRVPILLSPYMNARNIDLRDAKALARTIDDPPPQVTRELGQWIRQRDLVVGGIDVTRALADVDIPILCVLASMDGIVPPDTVTAVRDVVSGQVDVLEVGSADNPFAHADLFINDEAKSRVFEPLLEWLRTRDRCE